MCCSVLWDEAEPGTKKAIPETHEILLDLNLDQIINAITAGRQEYDLKPFYLTPLTSIKSITYRHEIMRDLENVRLIECIRAFEGSMMAMRKHLSQAEKLYYKYQKKRWFLDAVDIYCLAVQSLEHGLNKIELSSSGLRAFREYLNTYVGTDVFKKLAKETRELAADLLGVQYCLQIGGSSWSLYDKPSIEVRRYEHRSDYSTVIENTFEKFQHGAVKEYRLDFPDHPDMNHIEAAILNCVARLYPDVFNRLDDYCAANDDYLDETINVFAREVQFYMAYIEHMDRMKRAGYHFCYPEITDKDKNVYSCEGFDLALANKLLAQEKKAVCNDFCLEGPERILVVSGPNQGGKTTFARTFGQMHYIASLGLPVPGREARLILYDKILTHFEKEESIKNLNGKLQDDLIRIYNIFEQATCMSIIILNEIFTSTTLEDAIFLSTQVMDKIIELDALAAWVTFIDELSNYSRETVSMVSGIVPDNPAFRTFKITRKEADGLSYALSIAEKYRVTYQCLTARIKA